MSRNIEDVIQEINDKIMLEVSQLHIALPEQQDLVWMLDLHKESIIIQDQDGISRMLDNETGEYIVRDDTKSLQCFHVVRAVLPENTNVFASVNSNGYLYEVDFVAITNKKIADKICIKAFEQCGFLKMQNITMNQTADLLSYYIGNIQEWGQSPNDRAFRVQYRAIVQSIKIDYSIID